MQINTTLESKHCHYIYLLCDVLGHGLVQKDLYGE